MGLIHGREENTDGSCNEETCSLIEEFWGEHTPYEQMIAQGRHQNDIRGSREGAHQCVAEASATQG